jgi:hypothetical protein
MPQANGDAEIEALQAVIDALQPLDDEARNRVLEYTMRRLGMRELPAPSLTTAQPSPAELQPVESAPMHTTQVTDIRSLREQKQPSTAVEMATLVAYYLAELAQEDERREAVTAADIEKYFKQANYRLPTRLDMTLNNAASSGYFDRIDRGTYRLNPVGFNLVTQSLPRAAGQTTRRAAPRKRPTATPAKNPKKK